VLVKYYGLIFDSDDKNWKPRSEFLSNGLFRMTQPKYLNDKGSEARLWPYFNEFSPADYAWARKEHDKMQTDPFYIPSREELENFFLKPIGRRYGDEFPHLLHQEGFQSMEDYDKEQLTQAAEKINSFLVEALSTQLGILSLSKSDTNELMWTHYASEGRGLAVTFNPKHPFFSQFPPQDVSYTPDKRASLTYYKGAFRINGLPLKKFNIDNIYNLKNIMHSLISNGLDPRVLSERLLYSKAEQWHSENESRIVCHLSLCEEKKGSSVEPELNIQLPEELSSSACYREIYLKLIPFDAFESIILGYSMSETDKLSIIDLVKNNQKLSHVKIRAAKHNIFGKIEISDIVA
jgi:hypothetical protein